MRIIKAIFFILLGALFGFMGVHDYRNASFFDKTKVRVNVQKINNFEQLSTGKSKAYRAEILFEYNNRLYDVPTSITQWEYEQKSKIQKAPSDVLIYFSPITRQAYSQRALNYSRYRSKSSLSINIFIAFCCLLGALIVLFGKIRS